MTLAVDATMTGTELLARLEDPRLYIVDVRDPDEFADWQIPGAHNLPLVTLPERLGELPRERDLVMVCAHDPRATQGAQLLAEHGIESRVLAGGMASWSSTYDQVSGAFGSATVIQVRRHGKGCLSYVVGEGHRAVVIDPSRAPGYYQEIARERGWAILYVLDTHLHADHLSGGRELAEATGAELWLNPADGFSFTFSPLFDGKVFDLGEALLRVSSVTVPGHTEGSTMYQLGESAIFTGDTLFLESVGRPDLADQAEDFAHQLFHSLHDSILPLSDAVAVFPAHYGAGVAVKSGEFVSRPLGALRNTLPALALAETDFVAWAIANVKDRPGNYRRIAGINSGREVLDSESADLEVGPNRCAVA